MSILFANLIVIWVFMACGWAISFFMKKNTSPADIFWGLGFTLLAWHTLLFAEGYLYRKILIAVLVSIWGIRLSYLYASRNRRGEVDWRYADARKKYGNKIWWISLIGLYGFLNQANVIWVMSLSIQVGQIYPQPADLTWLDGFGTLIWLVGLSFEVLADHQLAAFKALPENHGKLFREGLWAYSRHPNYFGEVLIWWGIFLVASSNLGAVWTIVSPLTITILMKFWTGVPLMEKRHVEVYSEYGDYMRTTNALFPWFQK